MTKAQMISNINKILEKKSVKDLEVFLNSLNVQRYTGECTLISRKCSLALECIFMDHEFELRKDLANAKGIVEAQEAIYKNIFNKNNIRVEFYYNNPGKDVFIIRNSEYPYLVFVNKI